MPVAMNDFDANSKATADSLNVDWQYLLEIDNYNKASSQEWKQCLLNIINKNFNINASIMKEQHDMAMAEEKRRYEDLAKLLKKAMEEKEKWEKVARETQIIVTAMKHAIKKGQQNFITGLSSSDTGDVIVGEEVASNFRRISRDEISEVEPSAKRRNYAD